MVEAEPHFDALIIGAGFSGLYMPHRLRQAGGYTGFKLV
jgi:cation diffusion facilitator CzcD-associated flavoprotein CzcO